ncbi:MFS transporter [Pseudemcibacter aquimaris]|uniref:MFS transporter n=1 Tax=Pseudemcibacter aquimaris TaxID=2857064 RepID=UPI0020129D1E|nr:MFS transporter [Pseudemcibacter aquimaris]MCC3861584.1 MFS transporter [Pseudemcibacter aquimaris]WDU58353.1 MFS transporter [Pseudemcibacter aquimaris]
MPKIFYGWWITIASSVGLSTSPGQFAFGALGLFMIPLTLEFSADRADVALASTYFTVALALTSPFIGKIADRFGSKEVLLPSLLAFGLLLASIAFFVNALWQLYIIFALIGILAAGANALPYMRIIGEWFNKRRGLALGIAMAGGGAGYTYVPPMLQYIIDNYSWRHGYYTLAAIVLFIALPISALFLKNTPQEVGHLPDNEAEASNTTAAVNDAISFNEVIREKSFWILYLIFALLSFCLYGILSNLVPMLIDRGMEGSDAAAVAAMLGIAILVSRAGIGYFLDKYFAPKVAIVSILLSTIGVAMLAMGVTNMPAYIAALLIGLSIGTEFDLLAYLTTRYFGLSSFGMVYGLMFSAFLVGTSIGPVSFGASFDEFGSYVNVLILSAIILIITVGLFLLLPKYKYDAS